MTPSPVVVVNGANDIHSIINTTLWPLDGSKPEVLVQLDGGRQVLVPLTSLSRQDDGSYSLNTDLRELEHHYGSDCDVDKQSLVIPVMIEEVEVGKRRIETGRFYISKVVQEREELVDVTLLREEVLIERVPLNQFVDEPVAVRYEGDTIIISLVEEVPVVTKRLMLKEELRITRRQVETPESARVTLRNEVATVEHVENNDNKR